MTTFDADSSATGKDYGTKFVDELLLPGVGVDFPLLRGV